MCHYPVLWLSLMFKQVEHGLVGPWSVLSFPYGPAKVLCPLHEATAHNGPHEPCVSVESPLEPLELGWEEQRVSRTHPSRRCWVISRVRMPIRYWTWQGEGEVSQTDEGWMWAAPESGLGPAVLLCDDLWQICFGAEAPSPWVLRVIWRSPKEVFFLCFNYSFHNQN